jgi:hypothetical protein
MTLVVTAHIDKIDYNIDVGPKISGDIRVIRNGITFACLDYTAAWAATKWYIEGRYEGSTSFTIITKTLERDPILYALVTSTIVLEANHVRTGNVEHSAI